ncbi:FG-GAP-like repeat-containing protein [Janthinobacterium sp. SUN118]|uniref:FG-GAP-like repeat-containing protein n=1 Tax=Janthinobacterium sp. SUN118 TaxID=3004100 RepID=UPI0025B1E403|nr:FG-GAP-like repeat-containing protein [Janthinobacterium sp. SUN118]MDN2709879.1 FG-GAP-like repeat-containing protein [Janthinobacterium sp. SUN118]
MIFKWRTTLGAIFASLSLAGFAHAAMHTPGKFDVGALGTATYSIPIPVPPATAGMGPKLALDFNSHSEAGLMGKGWGIVGLSAILRCGQTIAQDGGVPGAINFDGNDRFCLDGERLVVSNGGVYGANGTEYRTERDSFSRIISYSNAGGGPAWFKVWNKSGEVMEYGGTADARIEAQGKATIRTWAINRVQDAASNFMTVSYTKEAGSGDYYPSLIEYTGNANVGMVPNNSVRFKYEQRPDPATMYQAGSMIKTTMRLSNIETYAGPSRVMDFRLKYGNYFAMSRLESITQCDGAGTGCLPSTTFGWTTEKSAAPRGEAWLKNGTALNTGEPAMWEAIPQSNGLPSNGNVVEAGRSFSIGDINGDGKIDLIQLSRRNNTQWILPLISNGTGFVAGAWHDTGVAGSAKVAGDINGDGRVDVVVIGPGYILPVFSIGSGFSNGTQVNYPTSLVSDANIWHAVDVNGDGRIDLVQQKINNDELSLSTFISNGNGFNSGSWEKISTRQTSGPIYGVNIELLPSELNGDGKKDFIQVWRQERTGNIWLLPLFSNGSGYNAGVWFDTGVQTYYPYSGTLPFDDQHLAVDMNGDGLDDLVIAFRRPTSGTALRRNASYQTFYFNGVTFISEPNSWMNGPYLYPEGLSADKMIVMDMNGDGRMDLVQTWLMSNASSSPGEMWLQPVLSTGPSGSLRMGPYNTGKKGITTKTRYGYSGGGARIYKDDGPGLMVLDIDGDGRADFVQQSYDGVTPVSIQPYFVTDIDAEIMNSITGGTGARIDIAYKPLTDRDVYIPDAQSAYPLIDLVPPLYVVSSVSSSNGKGGRSSMTFSYGGLKLDASRGKITGFRWAQKKNVESGIVSFQEYRQDWPYTGLLANAKTMLAGRGNGDRLKDMASSYACIDPIYMTLCAVAPGRIYFPYAGQSVEFSWDLNGTPLPANTVTTSYDNWGNVKQMVSTRVDGAAAHSTIMNNIYNAPDVGNWRVGQVQRSVTTNTEHSPYVPPFPSGPIGVSPGSEGSAGSGISNPGGNGIATSSTFWAAGSPSPLKAAPGQTVDFKVYVRGAVVRTGYVTFREGNDVLAIVALDASASAAFSGSLNGIGQHTITASYSGDARNSPSSTATTIEVRRVDLTPILMLLMDD